MRGLDKVRAVFVFAMAAYNIVRLPKLLAPKGRSASGDMKSERTMTQPSGQNLENEPHPPAKNRACLPGCANAATFSAACSHVRRQGV